ncbi:hypothetical protein GCM10027160_24820 [Streptomyces calidiresistens]|uniref:Septum formation-related domain-containing protein n=1 Tax=Streptomyces calidiresistens TaxID=1485586 RepID=A0A7W3T6N4_9ACTN|nr:hypothetical protein [Streptomyces calidiresistens]MBB0231947.1 hypothetical protein [Streptomyces calidiresistens]
MAATAVVVAVGLTTTACGGEEWSDPPEFAADDFEAGEWGAGDAADGEWAVGDCWGGADAADRDPRPCEEPHVYEVIGVHDGVGEADDAARTALCETSFADYFGVPPQEQGSPGLVIVPEPVPAEADRVVCSVYTSTSEEHTGSFR